MTTELERERAMAAALEAVVPAWLARTEADDRLALAQAAHPTYREALALERAALAAGDRPEAALAAARAWEAYAEFLEARAWEGEQS